MKIKGSTDIILKDEKTGKIKKYHDENMITNGLNMALSGYGSVLGSVSSESLPITGSLLGGIFLFSNPIEENANTMYPPTNNSMVGKASIHNTDISEDTTLGSYNQVESGKQPDGSYRYVFDFSTSHANGVISNVCLTSRKGGMIGYANKDVAPGSMTENRNIAFTRPVQNLDHNTLYAKLKPVFIDGIKNNVSVINIDNIQYNEAYPDSYITNSGKLEIINYSCGISKIKLDDNVNVFKNLKEKIEIQIPPDMLNAIKAQNNINKYAICAFGGNDDGKIYFIAAEGGNTINSGDTMHCLIINAAGNYETEYYTFINNCETIMLPPYNIKVAFKNSNYTKEPEALFMKPIWYYDGKVYIINKDFQFYKVDPTDGTGTLIYKFEPEIVGKTNSSTSSTLMMSQFFAGSCLNINGKSYITFIDNNNTYFTSGNQYNVSYLPNTNKKIQTYIYDTVDNSVSPLNCEFVRSITNGDYTVCPRMVSAYEAPGLISYGANFGILQTFITTINNLSEVITKTASQSMKVIYTLTFAQEEKLPEEITEDNQEATT